MLAVILLNANRIKRPGNALLCIVLLFHSSVVFCDNAQSKWTKELPLKENQQAHQGRYVNHVEGDVMLNSGYAPFVFRDNWLVNYLHSYVWLNVRVK